MKAISLLIILLGFSSAAAQTVDSTFGCGTQIPAKYKKWRRSAVTNNLISTLHQNQCVNKKFSIVFYVVADQAGTWGSLTTANLDTAVARLNRTFARICVSFMNCSTVVIPNHTFNEWDKQKTEKIVTDNWHTDNTINVYLPASITGSPSGYAYLPPGPDVVVVEKANVTGITMIHEMGHFFGLLHTWDEIGSSATPPPPAGVTSNEFVDRTNCYTNGDGFCDTEADCYPLISGTKDGNNKYYVVPKDNYMSYWTANRCRFTQEQYNFMANVILTQRMYLH